MESSGVPEPPPPPPRSVSPSLSPVNDGEVSLPPKKRKLRDMLKQQQQEVQDQELTDEADESDSDVEEGKNNPETDNTSKTKRSKNYQLMICSQCKKWRKIPQGIDISAFKKKWYCYMNQWDPARARCSAEQDVSDSEVDKMDGNDINVKNEEEEQENDIKEEADEEKQEQELPGKKQEKHQWVMCEECEKWRKIPPDVDVSKLPEKWYCHMNKWNPDKAICSAEQEVSDAEGHVDEMEEENDEASVKEVSEESEASDDEYSPDNAPKRSTSRNRRGVSSLRTTRKNPSSNSSNKCKNPSCFETCFNEYCSNRCKNKALKPVSYAEGGGEGESDFSDGGSDGSFSAKPAASPAKKKRKAVKKTKVESSESEDEYKEDEEESSDGQSDDESGSNFSVDSDERPRKKSGRRKGGTSNTCGNETCNVECFSEYCSNRCKKIALNAIINASERENKRRVRSSAKCSNPECKEECFGEYCSNACKKIVLDSKKYDKNQNDTFEEKVETPMEQLLGTALELDEGQVKIEREEVLKLWEYGNVVCFLEVFDFSDIFPSHFQFCSQKLLRSLIQTKGDEGEWLINLFIYLMKTVTNVKITEKNFNQRLQTLIDEYYFTLGITDPNPLSETEAFPALKATAKVSLLHTLCNHLLDTHNVRDQIKGEENMRKRAFVIGKDNNGSEYWLFKADKDADEVKVMFYKETFPKFGKLDNSTGRREITQPGSLETIATSLEQLLVFTDSFGSTLTDVTSDSAKLHHELIETVIPPLELHAKLAERRARKVEAIDTSLILDWGSTRRSRAKPVNYNYDYESDDDERRSGSRSESRREGSRRSARVR